MSRVGKKPIVLPNKVKTKVEAQLVTVEGPKGKLMQSFKPDIKLVFDSAKNQLVVERVGNTREAAQMHGMARAMIQNMVTGVSTGFEKRLDIEGVGYRADVKGSELQMTLGFSHPVIFNIPAGIKIAVEKQTKLTVSGHDKALVSQTASNIRGLRPPEPYKGKGIRYADEVIARKVGKAAAAASGGK